MILELSLGVISSGKSLRIFYSVSLVSLISILLGYYYCILVYKNIFNVILVHFSFNSSFQPQIPTSIHDANASLQPPEAFIDSNRRIKSAAMCRYEQPFIQKTCLQSALSANHTQAVTFSARYGI